MSQTTVGIQLNIDRLRNGDLEARGELLQFAFGRLQHMARKMKGDFGRLGRWEQTDDVLQNASLRLYKALAHVEIVDVRHFFRLAAVELRRELIDLCRHYHGPQGHGAHHFTQARQAPDVSAQPEVFDRAELTADPRKMYEWSEFHQHVQQLPEREREVVDLLWYHELPQEEAARMLDVSTRHVKRLWRSAKLMLHARMQGEAPGD
jgi:RNA polymerase sigma-70 factor (ECF subfamily)